MKNILCLIPFIVLSISCKEHNKKINHKDSIEVELKKDSSEIEIADLPINIDSTDYLIHPIGNIKEYTSRYSSKSSYASYNVSNQNSYSIGGEFSNIKFQHKDSSKLKPLFDKIVKIKSVHFLYEIKKNTGLEFLVYKVKDIDTNGDLKLNHLDINTLYISKMDGSSLKKLTKHLDQIIDWKTIPELNRLYLKSITDTNKNGDFDKEDKVNYSYVDLTDSELKLIEYHPIN